MKKKSNLKLSLKKQKVSELKKSNQNQILGGSYPSAYGNCGGGGGGGLGHSACLASCSCSLPGVGIC